MTSLFALRALLFAGECLGASVVLLTIAAIASRFLKQASLRHFVWLTAFGAMLVLPMTALFVPPQIVVHRQTETVQKEALPALAPAAMHLSAAVIPPAASPSWNVTPRDLALAAFALWLAGFGWAALRLMIAAIGVNALHMSSAPLEDDALAALDPDCGSCELRLASEESGPMTWGFVKPIILLPNEAAQWPRERLRAVLLHEMAHVRRHDSLAQVVSLIACALYWPNPLAWVAARNLRREAEIAADDAVIGSGVKPSVYAGELLHLAAQYRGARGASFAGLSMASQSALEARVKSVLTPNQSRRGVTSMDVLKIAGFGLVATAALAFARPSLAQDAPPTPPTPPTAIAANDLPPPPPPPPAPPEAPPAPPALAAPAAPPTPPTPPVADDEADTGSHDGDVDIAKSENGHRVDIHRHLHNMSPQERAQLHAILEKAHREIHEAMAKARPEMERAEAEIERTRPQVDRAMEEVDRAQPEIDRAMEEMDRHRPEMEKAMAEMKKVRPQIEKAMAEARKELAKANIDVKVRKHIDEAMKRVEVRMEEHHQHMMDHAHDMHDHESGAHDMDDADSDNDGDNDSDGK